MKEILITSLFLCTVTICNGQTKSQNLKIENVTFNSIFGYSETDSLNVFCLLGSGFFKAPTSEDTDSLISDWVKKHPKAKIFKVSSFGPTMTDQPNSKMTYCLVIEGSDTINNYLVRKGAVPGGTMQRPETSKMNRADRKFLKEIKQSQPNTTYYMDKKSYNRFIRQIISSENFARVNKLGIWTKDNPFE